MTNEDQFEKWRGLVVHLCRKYGYKFRSIGSAEDIVNEGYVGLLRAIQTFNPAKGKFSRYAYQSVYRHLYKASRQADLIRPPKLNTGYAPSVKIERGKVDRLLASNASHQASGEELLSGLSPEEVELFWLYHVDNVTLRELGERSGVSRERIRQRLVAIRQKLRYQLRDLQKGDDDVAG